MKKIFAIVCVTLAFGATLYADTFTTFSFEKTDSSTEHLTAIGTKITFSNSAVNAVNMGARADILLNQVAYMYFSNADASVGVDNIALRNVRLVGTDGAILLTAPVGIPVQVLNITGQMIATLVTTGEEQTIASLTAGMYIVQIGSETVKTIVR